LPGRISGTIDLDALVADRIADYVDRFPPAGVEPKEVQWMLRRKTLLITLETYVGWWPKRDRRRGIVGGVLTGRGGTSRSWIDPELGPGWAHRS
jgi:hypothetical protein